MSLDPNRFSVGTEFRHDKGGCWRIDALEPERITLAPIAETKMKPRDQLVGRNFKIFGVWFKVESLPPGRIVLRRRSNISPVGATVTTA